MTTARVLLRDGTARLVTVSTIKKKRKVRAWVIFTAYAVLVPFFLWFSFGKLVGL